MALMVYDDDADYPTLEERVTDACNRSFSDLDSTRYLATIGILCSLRTILFHPVNIALARKQALSQFAAMSTTQIIRDVYSKEGGLRFGLSKGCFAMVAGCGIAEVIYMGAFEYLREVLPLEASVTRDYASGYAADALCRSIWIPCLVFSNRQMIDTSLRPLSLRATASDVWKTGGMRSLYSGLGTTLVIGSQWTAVWWGCYAVAKDFLYKKYDKSLGVVESDCDDKKLAKARARLGKTLPDTIIHPADNVVLNSVASVGTSAFTALLFNPYLVLRTRLQVVTNASFASVFKQVMRESGIRGFWAGAVLNINASIVDAWMASTTYEWAKLYADRTKC